MSDLRKALRGQAVKRERAILPRPRRGESIRCIFCETGAHARPRFRRGQIDALWPKLKCVVARPFRRTRVNLRDQLQQLDGLFRDGDSTPAERVS